MNRFAISLGALAVCFLSNSAIASQQTVYQITDLPKYSNMSLSGTITTDGTLGALYSGNIVAWNINFAVNGLSETFSNNVTAPASTPSISLYPAVFNASPNAITFNGPAGASFSVNQFIRPSGSFISYSTGLDLSPWSGWASYSIAQVSSPSVVKTAAQSGPFFPALQNGVFATVAAVPEPETYAMMLAGLGLVALVARRRA